MSDSDYLISIGCENLVRGEVPSNYGDDYPPWHYDKILYLKHKGLFFFETFEEARDWAKRNPGRIVTKDTELGFYSKPFNNEDINSILYTAFSIEESDPNGLKDSEAYKTKK